MALARTYSGPYIDEKVEHVGISKLRNLNTSVLRRLDRAMVVRDNDKPLAVLLSYDQFLAMQREILSLFNTVELLKNDSEFRGVMEGLKAAGEGKSRSLAEIEAEFDGEPEKGA